MSRKNIIDKKRNPIKKDNRGIVNTMDLKTLQREDQFAIIGCGRFGTSLALQLMKLGADVMIVDEDEDTVQAMMHKVTLAVQADVTDEDAMKALGIRNFDTVIVCIGSDIEASILVTLMLKELGVKMVIAKAQSDQHSKVLYRIGADQVVFPEQEMGNKVAQRLMSSNFMELLELSSEYSIIEIQPRPEWIGKDLMTLNLRQKYGVNIISIKRNQKMNITLQPTDLILKEDRIVVIGSNTNLKRIEL